VNSRHNEVISLRETSLVVIDMQLGNFQGDDPVKHSEELLDKVRMLISKAREANAPIFFIMNSGSKGDPDEPGTEGWEIHPGLTPLENDQTIEKTTPDAFHKTGFKLLLDELDVTRLIVAGLQTEYCIDTTCRRAALLGYEVILASDAHSTWDSKPLTADEIIAHHNRVLAGWFVALNRTDEIVFE
jgi:nicotinamidase-related amidase